MFKRELLITEDGSHTIFIPELNETYHSIHGAIQESAHVFIENGLKYFVQKEETKRIRIFEVGFGSGLNALLSYVFAAENDVFIDYEGIEAFPLSAEEAQMLNYPKNITKLETAEIFRKFHKCNWNEAVEISPNFQLKKANHKIEEHHPGNLFDICFFDAFAPSKQAEMWEKSILKKVRSLLTKNGLFITYCAKGQLKRDLKSIGFEVETLQGPPGKMQMVRAIKI